MRNYHYYARHRSPALSLNWRPSLAFSTPDNDRPSIRSPVWFFRLEGLFTMLRKRNIVCRRDRRPRFQIPSLPLGNSASRRKNSPSWKYSSKEGFSAPVPLVCGRFEFRSGFLFSLECKKLRKVFDLFAPGFQWPYSFAVA